MLTVIEKVIFLQNVEEFKKVPTDQLAYLAAIAEEVSYLKGDIIFQKQDSPDALYLVLDGEIRLHIDDKEITTAKSKIAFGSWALFDDEPRVATATAIEESRLLRIDREEFFDLLADNIQITQAIIKSIVSRLKKLITQVGLKTAAQSE